MHRAANGGFLEVVQALVEAGVDLTLADKVRMLFIVYYLLVVEKDWLT